LATNDLCDQEATGGGRGGGLEKKEKDFSSFGR